jgi:hypothetical protein
MLENEQKADVEVKADAAQVVADTTQSAQTGENKEVQAAAEQSKGQEQKPQEDAFKAAALDERSKRQALESKVQQQEALLNVLSQNANRQQQTNPNQIIDAVTGGIPDTEDALLTGKQARTMVSNLLSVVAAAQQQQAFLTQHQDYFEVVGTQAQPSEAYLNVLKQNPQLAYVIQQAGPNAPAIAYALAKGEHDRLKTGKTTQAQTSNSDAIAAAIAAANRTGSVSQAQSKGNMDKRAQIKGMSDAQFKAYRENIKARG